MDKLSGFLKSLSQFEDYDEAKEYLEDTGRNVDELENSGLEFVKSALANHRLNQAEAKKRILQEAERLKKEKKSGDVIINAILALKKSSDLFKYGHSKLEGIDETEALSMLEDQELLELLNALEQDNYGKTSEDS